MENGLAALQVDLNEVRVELFASKRQHMMQLYASRYLKNTYCFYWRSMELCYANPPFFQLSRVLTKIALEGARVVLCTADCGTTGEHTYSTRLLDGMTVGTAECRVRQKRQLKNERIRTMTLTKCNQRLEHRRRVGTRRQNRILAWRWVQT